MIGQTLGHYEILEKIGAGGMGDVYRARDVRLDRVVAVKVLPTGFSQDEERRQRFQREAKTISSLQHPNICTLHDIGQHDGVDYLVMEYIEGETLAERLKRGPMPVSEVLHAGAEIAEALDRAHRAGIIHRDLKPGNVILTKGGVKLLDFGLAKIGEGRSSAGFAVTQAVTEPAKVGSDPSAPLTAQGTILGTFQYMAPEQLEGGEADSRSDIFALGAVLYEMATGRKAFEGKSQASLIASILEREPAPLSSVQAMTPPALDHVVGKCLAKDPDDRWQSASDVAGQLRWVATDSSRAGVPAVVSTRRRARARLAWSLAALFATAFLAMTALWLTSRPPAPRAVRFQIPIPEGWAVGRSAQLSADGRMLAFAADSGNGMRLWVRSLDDLALRPIPGTEGASLPFWSPDGRHVGFFTDGKLRKTPIGGGPSQTICDAPNGDAGSWSVGGDILFDGTFNNAISHVDAGGGTAGAAVEIDSSMAGVTFGWPEFLPGGRRFLFISIESGRYQLCSGDLDTRRMEILGPIGSRVAYAEPGYLLYASDRTLVARPFDRKKMEFTGDPIPLAEDLRVNNWGNAPFSVAGSRVLVYRRLGVDIEETVWVDRSGEKIEPAGERAEYNDLAISPDGSKFLMERTVDGNVDIWVVDPARGTSSRLSFSPNDDMHPIWSPDGSEVIHTTAFGSDFFLVRRAASGVGAVDTVATHTGFVGACDWLADGRVLLHSQNPEGGFDIEVLDTGTGERQVFLSTPFNEGYPAVSPDGRWIAYQANDTGRGEIYVRSFPSGEGKWQVSADGGEQPQWSPDGREILFLSDDRELMSVRVTGSGAFSADAPRVLFRVPWAGAGFHDFRVSGDGERFLFVRDVTDSDPEPLTVVMNWQAELEDR